MKPEIIDPTVRPIQTRLFVLLLRTFAAAVLSITVVILAVMAYFLTYPSSYNPIERLPIIISLETYYLVNDNWQNVDVLPKNQVLADFHKFWARSILLDTKSIIVLDHGSSQTPVVGTIYNKKSTDTSIPILVNQKVVGQLLFDETFSPNLTSGSLDFLFPIGVISLLMAIPTIIIGLVFMRRFVNPLAEVIAASRAVAGGDLSTRVNSSGPGDLKTLLDSFNHMAESLEQRTIERRNMLVDIAHELRTPLTVMRGRLEGIVDGVYEPTPEQVGPALEETYLLERLVEDLRLLTLAETGQLHFEYREVNLKDITSYVIDLFQAQAEDKNIAVKLVSSDEPCNIMVDPQRIKQVIGNLLSNALRYTPEGSTVIMAIEKTGENIIFSVTDNGPGVPAEDIENLFQRFWRGEKSRSRSSGGAGLGLAIVRQLIEAQGGTIRAVNVPQGGLQFIIKFSAGPQAS
ncbi:MAG: ATP-binding protein [Chloroflexota bacterium]